jgi:protein tyrosine phosphatase (PTP) superfamily phosphohydrolase (DUF442 family)
VSDPSEPVPPATEPAPGAGSDSKAWHQAWTARFLILAVVVTGLVLTIKHTRHYVIPKRFQEVEPGLYRSGQLERWPLERVLEDHAIKTVLRLNPYEDDPQYAGNIAMDEVETELVERLKLERIYIPMSSGSGIVPYEQLDAAADVVADTSKRPMLFHCYAGSRRSAAVHAAWRLKHSGYTWEQTVEELRDYGLTKPLDSRIYKHLAGYVEHLKAQGEGTAPVDSAQGPGTPNNEPETP